jgi:hypothetical protein
MNMQEASIYGQKREHSPYWILVAFMVMGITILILAVCRVLPAGAAANPKTHSVAIYTTPDKSGAEPISRVLFNQGRQHDATFIKVSFTHKGMTQYIHVTPLGGTTLVAYDMSWKDIGGGSLVDNGRARLDLPLQPYPTKPYKGSYETVIVTYMLRGA